MDTDGDASSWDPPTHDDLRWQEKQKAQAALLKSLQVDARISNQMMRKGRFVELFVQIEIDCCNGHL